MIDRGIYYSKEAISLYENLMKQYFNQKETKEIEMEENKLVNKDGEYRDVFATEEDHTIVFKYNSKKDMYTAEYTDEEIGDNYQSTNTRSWSISKSMVEKGLEDGTLQFVKEEDSITEEEINTTWDLLNSIEYQIQQLRNELVVIRNSME